MSSGGRLRVLHAITHLGLGGAEVVAFTLLRELQAECDFAVFTVHGQSGDEVGRAMERELAQRSIPWFRGTRVPNKLGGPLTGGWALHRALRDFRPDIVHCHAEPAEACAAVAALRARPMPPLVRTVHNSMYWRFWPRVGRWCDWRLRAARIACVSAAAREEFLRYRAASGAGAPPDDPEVIYNGVDVPRLPPRARPRHPGRVRVLFAGRFEPEKGPDLLCRALPAVQLPPGTEGELVLVGRGRLAPQVAQLAAAPPRGWRVLVQPPTADLPRLMESFDVLVAPSRCEGLGLVAIEAVCVGLPVVAADAQGLRETLPPDHPWRARVDDAADLAAQLSAALRQTDRWAEAGARAQAFAAERFSPERMARAYAALYRRTAHPS